MKQFSKAFHTIPILRVIPSDQLNEFISQGTMSIKTYSSNEIIHFDGDLCRSMEIILDGEVNIERIDEDGKLMNVATFNAGSSLGANLLYSSYPYYPMTISAKSNVNILLIKEQSIFKLCANNEDFLKIFLKIISDHTVLLGTKIKHYVNRTIREILTTYLVHESLSQNSNNIQLNCTKTALAQRMGVQRTSLSRELQKMKKEGLIDFDSKSITILNDDFID